MSQPKQLNLFEIEEETLPTPENGSSNFSDPSFAVNKTLPVHRWVPWIAGFSSSFVRNALHAFLDGRGTVLDPFAGVGTTLVEAMLLGHKAIGFEINPYAALACRTKVHAHKMSVVKFRAEVERLQAFYQERISNGYKPHSVPPTGFRTRAAFYSPKVLHKVLILQDFMDTVADPDLSELFRLAFASTMVRYSNYSYEPSLGRRVSAGKFEILDFPVGRTIVAKLLDMAEDITWMQANLPEESQEASVFNTSFFNCLSFPPSFLLEISLTLLD